MKPLHSPTITDARLLAAAGLLASACRKQAEPQPAPAPPSPPPAPPPPPAPKDADVYFKLIEPHFERVSIYDGPEVFLREYAQTPERARHLLAAHWCVSEISNGGFQQFFAGAAGVMGPEAVQGLQALGLNDSAAVLEQAMARLGQPYAREARRRNQALKRLGSASKQRAAFADLDQAFLRTLQARTGGFDAVAAAYARQG